MKIPVLYGRTFDRRDDAEAPPAAVVSRGLARRLWPGETAPGRRIRLGSGQEGGDASWITVVGVAGDVSRTWIENEAALTVYLPHRQAPRRTMAVGIRARAGDHEVLRAVREQVAAVDPAQPIHDVRSFEGILAEYTSGIRLSAALMGIFAVIAFFLSAAGIYAIVSHAVAQQTHEIGVRMALGAEPLDIVRLFAGQGLSLTLFGVVAALPVAFALTRLLSSFILGVISVHAGTFFLLAALLLAVGLLASYLPARRAATVDPGVTLRYQ